MKRFFLFFISFLIFNGLQAQSGDAGAIIEKTSQIYDGWEGMYVRFTAQLRGELNGMAERFEGTIKMKKNKFVLSTPDMTIWFDGTTQWTYIERIEEVNVHTPSDDEVRYLNPMILLRDYQKDFNVSCTGESTSVHAKMAYDLTFTPKKKNDIEKMVVQIEKSTCLPTKLVVTMRNQTLSTVINEMNDMPLDDGIFTFPKSSYPNAEIIDLR